MPNLAAHVKRLATAVAVGAGLAVGGCGVDDVEFNGSVFNAVGLGQKTKAAEPKLAQRTGLVLPPDSQRLPEPGTQPGAVSGEVAAIADPDTTGSQSEQVLRQKQAEYCKVHYEQAKARGEADADAARGPLGPCREGLFSAMQKASQQE